MRRSARNKPSNFDINNATTSEDEEDENIYPSTSSGSRGHLSQYSGENRLKRKNARSNDGRNALSQGSTRLHSGRSHTQSFENVESRTISLQEKTDLAGKIIRFLFVAEKKKHAIHKTHIVKNILGGSSKNFQQIIEIVKSHLSKVFGYKLVDIGSGKFILVNEIKNDLPHLKFTKSIRAQQVLLFIVLAQIFMHQESCREETLWDFLRRLYIITEDDSQHEYFGDVKKLITVDFVAQHYLDRIIVDKTDPPKFEYKWGIRAEHEVSRRDVLEFVSKIYGGCPINTWTQQYKAMVEKEESEES